MALLRYSTFLRVFKARWSDVLKFREKNLCLANNRSVFHCLFGNLSDCRCPINTKLYMFFGFPLNPHPRFSRCEYCFHLSQQISDRSASLEEKLQAVKVYRDHLHSQYCDRSVQWSLEEASRDPSSGVLTILLDGMDQAKFRLPKHPGHRAVSSMTLGQIWQFVSRRWVQLLLMILNHYNNRYVVLPPNQKQVLWPSFCPGPPRANVIRPSLKIHGAWAVGSLGWKSMFYMFGSQNYANEHPNINPSNSFRGVQTFNITWHANLQTTIPTAPW